MFEEELRVRSFQFSDFTYLSYFSVNNIHQGGPSTGRESQHNKPRRSLKQKNEWICVHFHIYRTWLSILTEM